MSYIDEACDRCGSKRKMIETRVETLETFSGQSTLEVSQIICTNEECQKLFEADLAISVAKSQEIKRKKEEADQIRKENIQKNRGRKKV